MFGDHHAMVRDVPSHHQNTVATHRQATKPPPKTHFPILSPTAAESGRSADQDHWHEPRAIDWSAQARPPKRHVRSARLAAGWMRICWRKRNKGRAVLLFPPRPARVHGVELCTRSVTRCVEMGSMMVSNMHPAYLRWLPCHDWGGFFFCFILFCSLPVQSTPFAGPPLSVAEETFFLSSSVSAQSRPFGPTSFV